MDQRRECLCDSCPMGKRAVRRSDVEGALRLDKNRCTWAKLGGRDGFVHKHFLDDEWRRI